MMSKVLASSLRRDRAEARKGEAEKAARKGEIFAQEVEAAEQSLVVGDKRFVLVEADLAEHVGSPAVTDRIAEGVEIAEIDAAAMGEHLLVERDRVRLLTER